MPTYTYECKAGHAFEVRCGVSARPEHPPCIDPGCDAVADQTIESFPTLWLVGTTHKTVLDYAGSQSQKAGSVHRFPELINHRTGARKGTTAMHPLAAAVQPEYKTSTRRREGLK